MAATNPLTQGYLLGGATLVQGQASAYALPSNQAMPVGQVGQIDSESSRLFNMLDGLEDRVRVLHERTAPVRVEYGGQCASDGQAASVPEQCFCAVADKFHTAGNRVDALFDAVNEILNQLQI